MSMQRQLPRIVNGRPVGRKPFNCRFDRTKSFPEKLWDAVSDPHSDIISWSNDGKSIVVEDKLFVGEVMKQHPGLVQIASFTNFRRQLREYGFDWYINSKCEFEFSHPCFTRCRPELIRELQSRRKCNTGETLPAKGDGTRGVRNNSANSFRGATKSQSDNSVNKATQVPVFFSPFAQPAAPAMVPLTLWQQGNLQTTQPITVGGGDATFNAPTSTQNAVTFTSMPEEIPSAPNQCNGGGQADGDHQMLKADGPLCHQPPSTQCAQQYCTVGQYPCNMSAPVWFPGTVGVYNPNCWYPGAPAPPQPCYGPRLAPASVGYTGTMIPPQDGVNTIQNGEPHPGQHVSTEQPNEGGASSHIDLLNVPPESFHYNDPLVAQPAPSDVPQTHYIDHLAAQQTPSDVPQTHYIDPLAAQQTPSDVPQTHYIDPLAAQQTPSDVPQTHYIDPLIAQQTLSDVPQTHYIDPLIAQPAPSDVPPTHYIDPLIAQQTPSDVPQTHYIDPLAAQQPSDVPQAHYIDPVIAQQTPADVPQTQYINPLAAQQTPSDVPQTHYIDPLAAHQLPSDVPQTQFMDTSDKLWEANNTCNVSISSSP